MTKLQLIKELENGIKQLKAMGELGKEVVVLKVVSGYSDYHKEINQLNLDFNSKDNGRVVIMDYSVCEQ